MPLCKTIMACRSNYCTFNSRQNQKNVTALIYLVNVPRYINISVSFQIRFIYHFLMGYKNFKITTKMTFDSL